MGLSRIAMSLRFTITIDSSVIRRTDIHITSEH
jgi:hypothetical protein